MPPAARITKEDILSAGLALIQDQGPDALNARALAARLNCSTQPIFSNFPSMDALLIALIQKAEEIFQSYMDHEIAKNLYPPYKASGMAYIRFAQKEPQLFRLLYMRDRSSEDVNQPSSLFDQMIHMVQGNTGLTQDRAALMHLEIWIFVHGLAMMAVTQYLPLQEEQISAMITDIYQGLKTRHNP